MRSPVSLPVPANPNIEHYWETSLRLWSISPKYLDRMGLVALWREGLLAQKVLLGQTRGYQFHPQLARFRASPDPVLAVGCYLEEIAREAQRRGYRFDGAKIAVTGTCPPIDVTSGQIAHEWEHLLKKLKVRAPDVHQKNREVIHPESHPLFSIVPGGLEDWERI